MFGVLKKSLPDWGDAHSFSILCIHGPHGELFVVTPSPPDMPLAVQGTPPYPAMSQNNLRERLSATGLSSIEVDEAIQLSRDWATTITGSASAHWALSVSS
jgi:hypothetical protein